MDAENEELLRRVYWLQKEKDAIVRDTQKVAEGMEITLHILTRLNASLLPNERGKLDDLVLALGGLLSEQVVKNWHDKRQQENVWGRKALLKSQIPNSSLSNANN